MTRINRYLNFFFQRFLKANLLIELIGVFAFLSINWFVVWIFEGIVSLTLLTIVEEVETSLLAVSILKISSA